MPLETLNTFSSSTFGFASCLVSGAIFKPQRSVYSHYHIVNLYLYFPCYFFFITENSTHSTLLALSSVLQFFSSTPTALNSQAQIFKLLHLYSSACFPFFSKHLFFLAVTDLHFFSPQHISPPPVQVSAHQFPSFNTDYNANVETPVWPHLSAYPRP